MNLLDQTIALARATAVPRAEICEAVGVTTRWYQKVLNGEIPEPSVVKIQRLHDFLLSRAESRAA